MIEKCYKAICFILSLFIISLFLYNILKANNKYKKKIIEGADLTDSDIQKMSDTAAELEQLKLQQSNIIKDINTVDTQTKAMNRKLTDEKSKIDDSIKKSESQAEDAKDGKEVCPE
jgi:peptidoglycan hydrolase CwlO-like protein